MGEAEEEEEGSMKSLPIPPAPNLVPRERSNNLVFELTKGIAAWVVMQETSCDADTALAAIDRQFSGSAEVDARDVMDRMSAACLDVVSRDE